MSQPDTIWWCHWYRAPGDQDYCSNVPDASTRHQDCGNRRLVSPSALVFEQDEHGGYFDLGTIDTVEGAILDVVGFNWPATNLGTVALDALAASQKDPSSTFLPSDPPIGR